MSDAGREQPRDELVILLDYASEMSTLAQTVKYAAAAAKACGDPVNDKTMRDLTRLSDKADVLLERVSHRYAAIEVKP